jgi:Cu/Ag efflux pump CusA
VRPTPTVIERDAVARKLDVSAGVSGRDLGAVVSDVKRRLAALSFPLEYHAQVLDDAQERQDAWRRYLVFWLGAALGAFLLLQAALRSWRLALAVFATLPLGVAGGALAAGLTGQPITLGSLVGFLAVLGLAVRHGLLLLAHYQHLEHHGGEPFGRQLVLRGAAERLLPTLGTALAVGAAFLPVLVTGAVAGQELVYPMAIVVVGGLVTSTALTLLVVPCLYLRWHHELAAEPFELDERHSGLEGVPRPNPMA